MQFLLDSLRSALLLAVSLDPSLYAIVWVSLKVSGVSTLLASLAGVPLGFAVAFESFRGKRFAITLLNTLLAVPTVVIGLFVYSFLSRRGLFGSLDLLYTQKAIVVGQTLLVFPMVTAFTIAAISELDDSYRKTAMTLGANRWQAGLVILREARFGIAAAVIAAFGRVISEVGISMMLGGNVKGFTRTMTTAMALEYNRGEFVLAVALGLVLLALAFGVNLLFHALQGRAGSR